MKKTTVLAILVASFGLFSCSRQNSTSNSSPSQAAPSPAEAAATSTPTSSFTVCKGTFALCTSAKCTPMGESGQSGIRVNCVCEVMQQSYSVGKSPCADVPQDPPTAGLAIPSRYSPISSMAVCVSQTPWAFCLDSACKVNPDGSTANCNCKLTAAPPGQSYVVVAANSTNAMCKDAIWSSATLNDVIEVTGFLYSQNPQLLPPNEINIVRVDTSQE